MRHPLAHVATGRPSRKYIVYIAVAAILAATAVLAVKAASNPATGSSGAAGTQPVPAAAPSYKRDVAPILERSCVRCHGPERADKGLRLDSYRGTLAGDSYGAVLLPWRSSLSAIVSVIKYGTMPHDGMKLPPAEIETVSRWIDAGAPEN